MKIARYIGDLLYDYECVVIPGLGGFITSETTATINEVTNHFKPPFKKIFFNAQLRANDGLLVNYVAKELGLTYKEAKSQVDRFVFICHDALKNGKRINFHRIGYIYFNKKEQIVFEQDTSINYNADSYGLISFVSPAVRRTSQEEILKKKIFTKGNEEKRASKPVKKPIDRKPAPKHALPHKDTPKTSRQMKAEVRRSPFKTQLTFVSLILLAMLIGIAIMHKESVKAYYARYSSSIPLFYRSPNRYLIDNLDKVHFVQFSHSKTGMQLSQWFNKSTKNENGKVSLFAKNSEEQDVAAPSETTNDLTLKKDTVQNTKGSEVESNDIGEVQQASLLGTILPDETEEKSVVKTGNLQDESAEILAPEKALSKAEPPATQASKRETILVIAGSFKNGNNARKLVRILKGKGYDALIADTNSYGMFRVSYGLFFDISKAESMLAAVRNEENPSAWILRK